MSLWSRIVNVFRGESLNRQIAEEFEFHIAEAIEHGRDPAEARRALGLGFRHREESHDARVVPALDSIRVDMVFAWRQIRRNPGFTFTVVITLALAVGANTAIFSLVNALLLKPLPYPQPERLVSIYSRLTGSMASDQRIDLDGQQWESLRDQVPSLLAAVSSNSAEGVNLKSAARVQYVHAGRVSASYFQVLGFRPALGRGFSSDEDRPLGPPAAVLSYALWRTMFAADPAIVGRGILLKGQPYSVVGVLPENAQTPLAADLYTPLQPGLDGEGIGTNYAVIARLRPGATWEQADSELARAWDPYIQRFSQRNPGQRLAFHTVPLQQGQTGSLRPRVLVLMLAAGFILMIACANLAGLTLLRVLRRTSEIATRIALGASRWHIQRQLWVENLLLALIGGAAGTCVGFLALRGLLALLPAQFLPVSSVPLDLRVLSFALSVSLATSVLFGMLPALATRRLHLRSAIAGRATSAKQTLRLRQALIAGEIALTVVLLTGSGLLIRSLIYLETQPAGFNPTGVLTAKASLDDARYRDPAAFRRLLDQSLAAMDQIPGVRNAAVGLNLPYERPLNDTVTLRDGAQAGQQVATDAIYVSPAYFDTLQIPLLAGRAFSPSDGPAAQPVTIVNRSFARKLLHTENPVGRYLDRDLLIVGMVADVAVSPGLDSAAPLTTEETIYVPAAQINAKLLALVHVWFQPSWIVRTEGSVAGLPGQMQRTLAAVDPNLPFSGFYSMSDLEAESLSTQRIEVALLGTMALLAILLSAVGIFALVANLVEQQSRAIGIRLALGSTIVRAMVHTGRSGVTASMAGLLLGLAISAILLRAMHSVIYGVDVYDPPTVLTVAAGLAMVTLVATTVPVLRIAAIDPVQTLRAE